MISRAAVCREDSEMLSVSQASSVLTARSVESATWPEDSQACLSGHFRVPFSDIEVLEHTIALKAPIRVQIPSEYLIRF